MIEVPGQDGREWAVRNGFNGARLKASLSAPEDTDRTVAIGKGQVLMAVMIQISNGYPDGHLDQCVQGRLAEAAISIIQQESDPVGRSINRDQITPSAATEITDGEH